MKEMTDGELARYLHNHLVHEVRMLRHAYERLGTFKGADFDMALENFALHGRVLVEFLAPSKKAKRSTNNVRASLYIPGFAANPKRNAIDVTLDKLDAQMMHSSNERTINPDDKFHTNLATALLDWIETNLGKFNGELQSPFTPAWMPTGQSPARLPVGLNPSATNHIMTTNIYVTGAMTDIKRAKPKI
jgi:hypothetical protein